MTRTIRGYQLTDGQEIDVLVVSRDEAATAFGNLDGRIGRHRPKWRRRSTGAAGGGTDDGTSEA